MVGRGARRTHPIGVVAAGGKDGGGGGWADEEVSSLQAGAANGRHVAQDGCAALFGKEIEVPGDVANGLAAGFARLHMVGQSLYSTMCWSPMVPWITRLILLK